MSSKSLPFLIALTFLSGCADDQSARTTLQDLLEKDPGLNSPSSLQTLRSQPGVLNDPQVKAKDGDTVVDILTKYPELRDAEGVEDLFDPKYFKVTRTFGLPRINVKVLEDETLVGQDLSALGMKGKLMAPGVYATPRYRGQVRNPDGRPWSSWYFPNATGDLFPAPVKRIPRPDGRGLEIVPVNGWNERDYALTKYDLLAKMMGPDSATEWARKFYAEKNWVDSDLSEGLCNSWSVAALTMPEPPSTVRAFRFGQSDRIEFLPGEMKGLVLSTFQGIFETQKEFEKYFEFYGVKNRDTAESNNHGDMYPIEFFRFIQVQLESDQPLPFLIDHDPRSAVWTAPIHEANYKITAIPEDPTAVLLDVWIYGADRYYADDRTVQGFNPSKTGFNQFSRRYQARLRGTREGDWLVIRSGRWLNASRDDHPDFVYVFKDYANFVKEARKPHNPFLSVRFVDQIVYGEPQ